MPKADDQQPAHIALVQAIKEAMDIPLDPPASDEGQRGYPTAAEKLDQLADVMAAVAAGDKSQRKLLKHCLMVANADIDDRLRSLKAYQVAVEHQRDDPEPIPLYAQETEQPYALNVERESELKKVQDALNSYVDTLLPANLLVRTVKAIMKLPAPEDKPEFYPPEAVVLDNLAKVMAAVEVGDERQQEELRGKLGSANQMIDSELRKMRTYQRQVEAYRRHPESIPDFAKDSDSAYAFNVERYNDLQTARATLNSYAKTLMPDTPHAAASGRLGSHDQAVHGGGGARG